MLYKSLKEFNAWPAVIKSETDVNIFNKKLKEYVKENINICEYTDRKTICKVKSRDIKNKKLKVN